MSVFFVVLNYSLFLRHWRIISFISKASREKEYYIKRANYKRCIINWKTHFSID